MHLQCTICARVCTQLHRTTQIHTCMVPGLGSTENSTAASDACRHPSLRKAANFCCASACIGSSSKEPWPPNLGFLMQQYIPLITPSGPVRGPYFEPKTDIEASLLNRQILGQHSRDIRKRVLEAAQKVYGGPDHLKCLRLEVWILQQPPFRLCER